MPVLTNTLKSRDPDIVVFTTPTGDCDGRPLRTTRPRRGPIQEEVLAFLRQPDNARRGGVWRQTIQTQLGLTLSSVRCALTRLGDDGKVHSPSRGRWAATPEVP